MFWPLPHYSFSVRCCLNVGYCGGYGIPVGTVIEPLFAGDAKTEEVDDLEHHFPCEMRPCFTSDSFVTESLCHCPAIYDMELFKINKLPHRKLYALILIVFLKGFPWYIQELWRSERASRRLLC